MREPIDIASSQRRPDAPPIQRSAIPLTEAERQALLASIDRQLAEIERRGDSAKSVAG